MTKHKQRKGLEYKKNTIEPHWHRLSNRPNSFICKVLIFLFCITAFLVVVDGPVDKSEPSKKDRKWLKEEKKKDFKPSGDVCHLNQRNLVVQLFIRSLLSTPIDLSLSLFRLLLRLLVWPAEYPPAKLSPRVVVRSWKNKKSKKKVRRQHTHRKRIEREREKDAAEQRGREKSSTNLLTTTEATQWTFLVDLNTRNSFPFLSCLTILLHFLLLLLLLMLFCFLLKYLWVVVLKFPFSSFGRTCGEYNTITR